ncbi:MAG TPA: YcjF family protein [Arsenophonus apicola]|uniref:YcjF family protein n=1 Tax=Arsenophonus TaxID=637 RepID=UPI0015D791E4|nr:MULTISPECIES: TIGR01620 family protein [Arsenophonus]UBX30422.1 YcjF family protein [Arsenophonus apicola]
MSKPLKSRIDFDESLPSNKQPKLKKAKVFDPLVSEQFAASSQQTEDDEREGEIEALVNAALKPRYSFWRKLVVIALSLIVVSFFAQTAQWVYRAWLKQVWVSLAFVTAGGLIIIAAIGSIITEWRRLYYLKERSQERIQAKAFLQSHGMHGGREFCLKLGQQSALGLDHPAMKRWQRTIHDSHNDKEIVTLYSQLVQPILDEQARKEINRSSAESALIIAVSPLAIVDMAFIAWRNIRLINRIATIYGIELGYYSRIRLFKMVLLNIAFAGASELVREIGMDWLSQDIMARLSTRAAQGIGAGLLTARLGIKTMELCRPLPWMDDKPKLADFRRQLFSQLKNIMPKAVERKNV